MYLKEETHHIPKNWKLTTSPRTGKHVKPSLLPQNPSWGGRAGSHLKSSFKDKQKCSGLHWIFPSAVTRNDLRNLDQSAQPHGVTCV